MLRIFQVEEATHPILFLNEDPGAIPLAAGGGDCAHFRLQRFGSPEDVFAAHRDRRCNTILVGPSQARAGLNLFARLRREGDRVPFVFLCAPQLQDGHLQPSYPPVYLGEDYQTRDLIDALEKAVHQGERASRVLRKRERHGPTIWPSLGEWPVYDHSIYCMLMRDRARNDAYMKAIERLVEGKVVVDLGTGSELLWARRCKELGARTVYAVESMEDSSRRAQRNIDRHGLDIHLIAGDIRSVELPERADVCVSDLIGCIGSSEGVCALLSCAHERLLTPGCLMIPSTCVGYIAAVEMPRRLRSRPRIDPTAMAYLERIFELAKGLFDIRVGFSGFPRNHLLSHGVTFETLDFSRRPRLVENVEQQIRIHRGGNMAGFLVWHELWTANDVEPVNTLVESTWYPIFIPCFYPRRAVHEGDKIEISCSARVSSDGVHPDYFVEGRLVQGSEVHAFSVTSPHHSSAFKGTEFHKELFSDLRS
jgi:hypothetical protein